MSQTIKLKRSSVTGKAPTTTDLELGELAINTFDGKLFIKKDDGTASIIEVGSAPEGYNNTNWDTAYGWGNHGSAGYLTSIPTPSSSNWWNGYVGIGGDGVMEMGKYMDFHTTSSGGNNDYDLRVTVSPGVFAVGGQVNATGGNSSQWNTAYGWGDHALEGYLTSLPSHVHTIANVTGLQSALNGKVDDGQVLTNVPAGAVFTDTVYSLPEATATTRGGIEIFSNTDQTVAANAVSTTAGRTYGIQLNSAGQAVVNVPWVDTNTNTWRPIHDTPVNGATTTSISSNWAFDNVKTAVPTGALFTDTVYTHPSHPGDDISIDTGPLSGATVISDLDFNVTTDTLGHVTDANATISTRSLTAADIGAAPSSHSHNYISEGGVSFNGTYPVAVRVSANNFYSDPDISFTGATSILNTTGGYSVGTTTFIDSARNLTNIGSISTSGGISVSGNNAISSYAGSFNFITGSLTGNVTGTLTGNASSATKWQTARTLSLTGDVTGSVSWDGSANASITATVANDSHSHSNYLPLSGGTITGNVTFTGADGENALTLSGTSPTLAFTDTGSEDDFYIHVNSNNFYILRDTAGVGNYGAWNSPHAFQLESDTNIGYLFGNRIFADNYHPNSDKWTTARTITLSGDLTGSVSIDGSANVTLSAQVVNDSHNHNHSDGAFTVNGQLSVTGNAIKFANNDYINYDDGANVFSFDVDAGTGNGVVRSGTYQIGTNTVIDSSRNATFAGGSFSESLVVGSNTSRKPIQVKSNSWAEVQFFTAGTEYIRIGSADGGLGTSTGDFYVYDVPTNQMNLIVKRDGLVSARTGFQVNGTTVIDSSRNLTNIGLITCSGSLTSSGNVKSVYSSTNYSQLESNSAGGVLKLEGGGSTLLRSYGISEFPNGLGIGNTTVIDSSRNLTNIGTVSTSGTITGGGEVNASGDIYAGGGQVYVNSGNADVKLGLWGNNSTTYGIGMTSGVTYGGLNDYAMTFCMNNEADRGFWWGYSGQSKSVGAMSLTTAGVLTVAGTITTGTNGNISTGTGGSISAFSNVTASNGFVKSGSGGFYVSNNQIVDSGRNLLNIGNITCSGTNNTYGEINIREDVSAPGYTFMRFQSYSTGATLGSIYRSYGSMVYSTSSDYRLKENVVDLTGASAKVMALPVRRFNFIAHPERTVDGFLAHEVAEVVPEAVLGEKDAVDSNGKPVYQGIDQSKLVPLLTAGLQEALAEIEKLKARLSALEN